MLDKLPLEILFEVAKSIGTHSTLRNLCLTSKALSDAAQPVLFSTYCEPKSTQKFLGNPDTGDAGPWITISLLQFTRTIILRPDLARHVRTLKISTLASERHPALSTWPHQLNVEIVKAEFTALEARNLEPRLESVVPFLLSTLINIRIFLIDTSECAIEKLAELGSAAQDGRYPRPLWKLKELHLGFLSKQSLAESASVLELPTLKELSIKGWMTTENEKVPSQLQLASSNVQRVSLYSGSFDIDSIKALLSACKNLQVLRYNCFENCRPAWTSPSEPQQVFSAIQSHGQRLRELQLEFNLLRMDPPTERVTGCPNLKYVTVNAGLIEYLQFLPDCIEHIQITRCGGSSVWGFLELAKLKETHFRSMRLITVNADRLVQVSGLFSNMMMRQECWNKQVPLPSMTDIQDAARRYHVEIIFEPGKFEV
ncbi:hypothetical protein BT63DRAFT_428080 [Microthyrium microscopicum]|uniref:F-box domain-containing protein n=1 Tax=Microthyrium microscopicum TaxID=703497 RepID=A0A6A6U3R7_9PEZI|nr:hypothetical protein BT63DRAFT_428080 [Microthyrium microscopicum]